MTNPNTKFIFITGGVVSSLGKGLASASIAATLQGRGTTGKIYQRVIDKERHGEYLGATIQVVPHVTNEIKNFILSNLTDEDFVLCEIGGTVGDIEGQPYLEAIRQVAYDLGRDRVMFVHLTLLPFIPTAGELKTKPTQHSVKKLQEYGIQPDMLLCRSQMAIPENEKRKLALFCNVREENVIAALDVSNIYQVPLAYSKEGMDNAVCRHFGIPCDKPADLSKWEQIIETIKKPEGEVTVAVVGKYTQLLEAYKSLHEAIKHGGIANHYQVRIKWIDSEKLESEPAGNYLNDVNAIIVPGGFGQRGTAGKIEAVKYAREHKIPFLGICFGMQMAVIETMRNVCKIKNANTTEFDPNCEPVVGLMTEWDKDGSKEVRHKDGDLGGTMRLGAYPCNLMHGSKVAAVYGTENILERHRHRYEVNLKYEDTLKQGGMIVSGKSPDGKLPEIVERPDHPWFIAVQFHPELKSKPFAPHPLFVSLIKAAIDNSRLM